MDSANVLLKLALTESDTYSLRNVLQLCIDNKYFQKDICNIENIISLLNPLLNLNSSFENGLDILNVLLPQCKSDVIAKHLLRWLQLCCERLQSHDHVVTLYSLLGELITYSKDIPDVRKQTSLTIVPKFMEVFFKNTRQVNPEVIVPFLSCVDIILIHYGKACGHWKKRIEQFLFLNLESSSDVVFASAKCFLNLLACGPCGADMEEYKVNWYDKQMYLVGALHMQLDNLFNSINEVQGNYDKYIIEDTMKWIPTISDSSSLVKSQSLTVLFDSLSKLLKVMLLGCFPVCKRIDPEAILSVVCRGLAVNSTHLELNPTNDSIILSAQIPNIQKACLSILDSLIQCGRRSLLSYGKLINKLLIQTLKWTITNDNVYGRNRPFSSLRVATYNCYSTWLTIARKCSNVEVYINEIVASLLSDVHFEKPSITLNVTTKRLKGKVGKKERKKKQEIVNVDNKSPVIMDIEANKEVCESALNFIPLLLESSSYVISAEIHKQLQECIVNELMLIQIAESVESDLPIPYVNDSCRLGLYKALLALCNNTHPEFTAPCNYAMPIFTHGLNDNCFMITRFCGQAVGNIEKMLHNFVGEPTKVQMILSNGISSTSNTASTIGKVNNIDMFGKRNEPRNEENNENNTSLLEEMLPNLFNNQESDSLDNLNNINRQSTSNEISENNEINIITADIESTLASKNIAINIELEDECGSKELIKECTNQLGNGENSSEEIVVGKEPIESSNQMEEVTSQKRLNSSDSFDNFLSPPEKKKKEETIVENDKLEEEMLLSFVDVVN